MVFINLGEWLTQRSTLTPQKTALVDYQSGARLTYQSFDVRTRALAAHLQQRFHLQPGERVAVLALNAPAYLVAFFACSLLGAILVPLNWRLTLHELQIILDDCTPMLLLYDERHSQRATALAMAWQTEKRSLALLAFADFPGADLELASLARPYETKDGEETAVILYTSGTTGIPKGVMLSHRMITWNAINTQVSWGLRETDVTPTFAPFFHAGGLNVLTTPLFHLGGTVVLLSDSQPRTILQVIERERCTVVFAVPTVFQSMLADEAFATADLTSIRFCVTGGSSCPLPLIQGYAARGLEFRQGYGLTEVGVNCFSLAPEDALRKAGSVGRPVFHSRVRVVDDDDRDVSPGTVGELVLAGPHVCSGYWLRPQDTAEAWRGGWWHTGDLVRCDAEGYYFIVGRKKDMFISGGENIYPAEVEQVLLAHPDILEAAVIPQPDSRWGEVGVAVVVLRSPGTLDAETLLLYCSDKLARYKLPRSVYFTETLPRNVMGKVLKTELARQFL